jgi:hypothetical protein
MAFPSGILLAGRVEFDFVTSPSLSSLKLWIASLAFAGLVAVSLAGSLGGGRDARGGRRDFGSLRSRHRCNGSLIERWRLSCRAQSSERGVAWGS